MTERAGFEMYVADLSVTADDIPGGLNTSGDATTIHGHDAHISYTSTDHLVSINWNGHRERARER